MCSPLHRAILFSLIHHNLHVDPVNILKENPIQKELTAVVKPLSESRLPILIEENLRKEQALKNEQVSRKGMGPGENLDGGPSLGR